MRGDVMGRNEMMTLEVAEANEAENERERE